MSIYCIGQDILDDDYVDYEYWCPDCKKWLDVNDWRLDWLLGRPQIICNHCESRCQKVYEEV